jgi:hypothetical protein
MAGMHPHLMPAAAPDAAAARDRHVGELEQLLDAAASADPPASPFVRAALPPKNPLSQFQKTAAMHLQPGSCDLAADHRMMTLTYR